MPLRFISSDSDSDSEEKSAAATAAAAATTSRLFGRHGTLHELLGGGKVADVVLWRKKQLSAAIMAGFSVMWFLLEVVGYHLLTLLCHISIIAMLLLFLWSNAAALLDRSPPNKFTETILAESAFRDFALAFHSELSSFFSILQDVAMGKNLRLFFLAITSLWIISIIGSSCSTLNLLYFGYLCIQILPVLYENYEAEVEHLVAKGSRFLRKLYRKFDSEVLNKIPRGPVKDKKQK